MRSIAVEMQQIAFEAAAPVHPGETVKRQRRRAYEVLAAIPGLGALKEWRVVAAWKGEAGCWSAAAVRDFEVRRQRLRASRQARLEAGREAAERLGAVYGEAADRLRRIDADFHRDEIARLELAARRLGTVAGTGAQG